MAFPAFQVLLAESYGGRDEPVDSLRETALAAGLALAAEPLRVREDPTAAVYQASEPARPPRGAARRSLWARQPTAWGPLHCLLCPP